MKIKWVKVNFAVEKDQFEKICNQLTGKQTDAEWEKNYAKLQTFYKNSAVLPLKPSTWNSLGNTDANKKMTMEQIQRSIQTNKLTDGPRDIYGAVQEITSGSVRAPIILSYRGKSSLVDGNVRLMACRLLDISPSAVIVEWR